MAARSAIIIATTRSKGDSCPISLFPITLVTKSTNVYMNTVLSTVESIYKHPFAYAHQASALCIVV
jgi:hypothetical protein